MQKSGIMSTTNKEKERNDYNKIRKANYQKNKETPDQADCQECREKEKADYERSKNQSMYSTSSCNTRKESN